jgi:NTE family protein
MPAHCDRIALVLQGGGALGAYQAGVFATLAEAGYRPDWVAGVSIGAINAALIAGNAPEHRIERLHEFWTLVSSGMPFTSAIEGDAVRSYINQWSSLTSIARGVPGFFQPRLPPPWLQPSGSSGATSFYDTSKLRATLERLIDFDRLNQDDIRLSIGAVNLRSGNSVYFDSARQTIRPEHIMASSALPPGFPAVEIDGELYWDGGVVSNTPLQYVLDDRPWVSSLVFQVDLFSAEGPLPRDMPEVYERQKEIMYSSRTRLNTDMMREIKNLRRRLCRLIERLPEDARDHREIRLMAELGSDASMSIVHLIYRSKHYELESKDYEFSRRSMTEHWQAGVNDTRRTLRHPKWLEMPDGHVGVRTFDMTRLGSD